MSTGKALLIYAGVLVAIFLAMALPSVRCYQC